MLSNVLTLGTEDFGVVGLTSEPTLFEAGEIVGLPEG
jgi:hypothetical protein